MLDLIAFTSVGCSCGPVATLISSQGEDSGVGSHRSHDPCTPGSCNGGVVELLPRAVQRLRVRRCWMPKPSRMRNSSAPKQPDFHSTSPNRQLSSVRVCLVASRTSPVMVMSSSGLR